MKMPRRVAVTVCAALLSAPPARAQFSQEQTKLVGSGTVVTLGQTGAKFDRYRDGRASLAYRTAYQGHFVTIAGKNSRCRHAARQAIRQIEPITAVIERWRPI